MKILIAVPTYENIYPDTFKSIFDLDKGEHDVMFEFIRGYDCAAARNKIVKKAIELKVDFVMMVDNDVVLPKDALLNLISHGKDVVMGYYAHRLHNKFTGESCVCKLGEFNYTKMFTSEELKELRENGEYLIQIHGGGSGCILIRTSLFQKIDYPWYKWVNYQDGGVLSEDLYFCEQCKAHGVPMYVDTRVSCGHIFRSVKNL